MLESVSSSLFFRNLHAKSGYSEQNMLINMPWRDARVAEEARLESV